MRRSIQHKISEIGEWLGTGTLNFFGKPFAGKDAQASRMASYLGASVVSGGDILRKSEIPPDVRELMNRGELIPSDRYREIVLPYFSQAMFSGKPLFLSAAGRVAGEELGVMAAADAAGHPTMAVPYLAITEGEVFHRLRNDKNRGRADDTEESLKTRLEEFRAKTLPVLETYKNNGLLITIDAMPEERVVFNSLVQVLHEHAMTSTSHF